jgi:dihydroorotase
MKFDLLIKGGEIVDPAGGYSGVMDVAIKRDRIAAVDRSIPSDSAFELVDASGHYVTPGLVDMHAHVYRGVGYWGVHADSLGSRTGVTTWLDVGSPGAMTLQGFREYIVQPSTVRIYALLNISYLGLIGPDYELVYLDFCDVDIFERVANLNRDLVLGAKVRMGASTLGPNGLEPMKRAREAADRCELPLMVHIAFAPPPVDDILDLMKAGDILTHCFTGFTMKIVDDDGRLRDSARRARERGVIMDIGHGAGSFSFETAEALLAQSFKPDVISTDVHWLSIGGPMFDLPTCLTKFLHLGLSLPEVIRASTSRPAEIMGLEREIGSLKPGMLADVAVFALDRGRFPLYDIAMNVREAKEALRNTMTIVGGRPMPRLAPEPPPPWIAPGPIWPDFQAELAERQRTMLSEAPSEELIEARS